MNFKPGKELQEIVSDNKSGSAELLLNLNSYISSNFKKLQLEELVPFLRNQFKEFSIIINYLNRLENLVRNKPERLSKFFAEYGNSFLETIELLFENSKDELKKYNHFITISNSYTLSKIFQLLSDMKNDLSVTVCESRPALEGRVFAENLSASGIKVNFITEAMMPDVIKNADAAIIGADTILSNGNVVNKIGSKLLAITCGYFGKPFYVAADGSKMSSSNKYSVKEYDGNEIWEINNDNINIRNCYFEIIEKELITKILSER